MVGFIILAVTGGARGVIIVFPFIGIFSAEDILWAAAGLLAGFLLLIFVIFGIIGRPEGSYYMQTDGSYFRAEKTCEECGRPIPEGGIFCSYCGSPTADNGSNDNYFE